MPSRIEPLALPLGEEHASMMKKWMPPLPGVDPLALFRVLLRNPKLSEKMRPLGAFQLSRESSLTIRDRELAIDRTCARCRCEYEWGVHAALLGAAAGFDSATIAATVTGDANNPVWSDRDRCLISLVDSLHDSGTLSDELWQGILQYWTQEQALELAILCGFYHAISFVANMAGLAPEAWATRFPARPE